ncbi:MAG: SDR family oxidoreductase [Bacteroidia bacterium]|nr:SDR family oxidoreductase [Bacteroidia bacterium]
MFQENTLKGKTIIVTGGGSGLGFFMAKAMAKVGANIAICGRRESVLQSAKEELASMGCRANAYTLDVRNYNEVESAFKQIASDFGTIDGLINNAAGNFLSASEDISPNGFKTVVDIVLHGTFNCTQNAAKYWIAKKQPGVILNIVTTYTETGCAFVLPSACAKAGVYALTNTLAYEWATYNIRVNSIAPGPFPTEGAWSRLMPDSSFESTYLSNLPMKRYGKPEELTNLVVFLMSDMAPYITGECISIDGGERLSAGMFNYMATQMPRENLKAAFAAMRSIKK